MERLQVPCPLTFTVCPQFVESGRKQQSNRATPLWRSTRERCYGPRMLPNMVSAHVRPVTAAFLLVLGSCTSQQAAPDIAVKDAWVRETVAGQRSAAAYVTIFNRGGGEDRLIAVSSPAAAKASLHSNSNDSGIARMRPISEGVVVPPGGSVAFRPGDKHVMLTGLSQPLSGGESIELRLLFQRSGERRTPLRVVSAAGGRRPHAAH